MKYFLLFLFLLVPLFAQNPEIVIGTGVTGGGGGSGTVSGTSGSLTCFTGDTAVGNCIPGEGITWTAGTVSTDPAAVPLYTVSAGSPNCAAYTEGRYFATDATNDILYWSYAATLCKAIVDVSSTQTLTNKSISGSQITSAVATATALAANPTNCSAGNYPLGIDANGNAESCTPASGGSDSCIVRPLPYDGVQHISNATGNTMQADLGVYVTHVYVPCDITVNSVIGRIGTGNASALLYMGLFSMDGNTRYLNASGSAATGSTNVTMTVTSAPVTISKGEYMMGFGIDDSGSPTTASCIAVPGSPAIVDTGELAGKAANAISGGAMPTTLGTITYAASGANFEAACIFVLQN